MKERSPRLAPEAFEEPVYVTRPILPDLRAFTARLERIWETRWFTNKGALHEEFGTELARYLKVPYLSLFNNGTIALLTACRCLELSGEVITTPFTFPATPHVLTWNHITPVFCDIEPRTMNMDARRIEPLITRETTGILAVHVYGAPCDVQAIREVAVRRGLKVIYDAAHAFGVEVNGEGIGNFGDVTMMSFHATKLFHTAEGGALIVKDPERHARIELMKNFGIVSEEEVVLPGINGKMSELHAALGLAVLECVSGEMEKRKRLAEVYRQSLANMENLSLPCEIPGVKSNYQYFVVRIHPDGSGFSRDYVYEKLKEYNVFARKYFFPLCSEYGHYARLPSSNPRGLPQALKASREVLCLPIYGDLKPEDVRRICSIIKSLR
ncbi:MAG: DegT/DnrJ/EryC1/StrS family aminotransferase [bacterium]